MKDLKLLEQKLGYRFRDRNLITTALTHSSYIREHEQGLVCNERLEFLGDAFFDAIIGEEMYRLFPEKEEGFLSRIRATVVCEKSLAREAKELELGEYMLFGHGEEKCGGKRRQSILADALEAVIGAVYLDGGFDAAREMVLRLFRQTLDDTVRGKYIVYDYKTHLQEALQARGITDIQYVLTEEEGPDHDKTFTVRLCAGDMEPTEGRGKSKKQAEQNAAREMLERGH